MIDIHAHILPGVDDGAADINEALNMARVAVSEGINGLIATPHIASGLYSQTKEQILSSVSSLNNLLIKEKIPLILYPGAEYLLEPDIPDRLRSGEILTLNNGGKYLLVEFPSANVPLFAETVIFELLLQGVTPVIAHPERNLELQRNPGRLAELINKGALAQATLGSVAGTFGDKAKSTAASMVKKGLVHFLASDAHSSESRPPAFRSLLASINSEISSSAVEILLSTNPKHLIQGERIKKIEPVQEAPRPAKKNMFNRLARLLKR